MILDGRYVEALWLRYLRDQASVAPDWRNAFDFITLVYGDPFKDAAARALPAEIGLPDYLRRFGHLHARLDPLGLAEVPPLPGELVIENEEQRGLVSAYGGSLAIETAISTIRRCATGW